jgi:hypothetical protein
MSISSISGSNSMIRLDNSRETAYLYADKPKLNIFQKAGRFLGKLGTAVLPIAGAVVSAAVPGFGIPLGLGLFGAGQFAGDVTANALAKDQAQIDAYNQDVGRKTVSLPGLFEQASYADYQVDFITPPEFNSSLIPTISNRELSGTYEVENFQFY